MFVRRPELSHLNIPKFPYIYLSISFIASSTLLTDIYIYRSSIFMLFAGARRSVDVPRNDNEHLECRFHDVYHAIISKPSLQPASGAPRARHEQNRHQRRSSSLRASQPRRATIPRPTAVRQVHSAIRCLDLRRRHVDRRQRAAGARGCRRQHSKTYTQQNNSNVAVPTLYSS